MPRKKPLQSGAHAPKQRNEGEGNRTAARNYDRQARDFARSGRVAPAAERAVNAISGAERAELEKAEEHGRRRARH